MESCTLTVVFDDNIDGGNVVLVVVCVDFILEGKYDDDDDDCVGVFMTLVFDTVDICVIFLHGKVAVVTGDKVLVDAAEDVPFTGSAVVCFCDVCCIDDVLTDDKILDVTEDVPIFVGNVVNFCDVICSIGNDVFIGDAVLDVAKGVP